MEIGFLLIGLVVGAAIGWLVGRRNQSSTPDTYSEALVADKKRLEKELELSRSEVVTLHSESATLNERLRGMSEKLDRQKSDLENLQKQFTDQFQVLANKIFEEKSEKFTEQNKRNIDNILSPIKEKLQSFEKKVETTYKSESKERIELKTEINILRDLNKQLSSDAKNLVNALKGDSKVQGDWGEWQLETLLEKAGLTKGIHFTPQSSFRDEDGSLKRPDFIIHLPENKNLIIDSKVSLTAYEAYTSSGEEQRDMHLKNHIQSLRQHLRDLAGKNYQGLYDIHTPDYVLMFVPIEPALTLALFENEKIFSDAFDKNIVLVSSSTLLATMKTVSFIWKQEDQKKNVLEIARQGASLYDKFVGFTEDMLRLGKQLKAGQTAYTEAMKKLTEGKDNLVRKTERLRDLGLEPSKRINTALAERSEEENDSPKLLEE